VNPDSSQPIPVVDSHDLRAVWDLTRQTLEQLGGERSFGIDINLLTQVCHPGANVFAVFMRSSLLDALVHEGLLKPPLDRAVFDAAAAFPIPAMDQFRPDDFIRELEKRRI
jgi:hypothetical protein